MTLTEPVYSVQKVSKSFGAVKALEDVDLNLFGGEIHAVLGENGAGKSTLMNVLAGFLLPDSGVGTLNGLPVEFGHPSELRDAGVAMVHQHFMLVPAFTVAENLALARSRSLWTGVDSHSSESTRSLPKLGQWLPELSAKTRDLSVGSQQRLEILKALDGNAKILILDEPTAVLSPGEVEDLAELLKSLRDLGVAVVLIAHKLSEVTGLVDRVTVLRNGKLVASCSMADTNAEELADWMVGEFDEQSASSRQSCSTQDIKLEVENLWVAGDRGEDRIRGVSFDVHSGEVFGIGGVDGNGQVELAEALAGVRRPKSGSVKPHGAIGYVPQDRQYDGLSLGQSVRDNLLVGALDDDDLFFGPFLKRRHIEQWGNGLLQEFDVKASSVRTQTRDLSGGNQQKVVLARVFSQQPSIIVLVNPTRGLDIKATDSVHARIREAAVQGNAIVLVSTDHDELLALSDQVTYLDRGRLTNQLVG